MVSDAGRIKSLERDIVHSDGKVQHRKEHIKKQVQDADGYMVVGLNANAKQTKISVHRLVAKAFVPGWFEGAEVNHIDFDRTNNHASNLEWISHNDNIAHSYLNGRHNDRRISMCGSGNPNYGNHILRDRYASDANLAREKQSRPGIKNGRSTPVSLILTDGTKICFPFYRDCAKYLIDNHMVRAKNLDTVSNNISKSAKSGSPYDNLMFELI